MMKKKISFFNLWHVRSALHVLIGNAGSGRLGTVREMTLEDFQFNLDINLVPNFVLTKHALPHLEKTRGNIVYISSVSGIRNYRSQTHLSENRTS